MSGTGRQLFFESICRTCMMREQDSISQFQSIFTSPVGLETLRISELLNGITQIQIEPTDGLPNAICSNCLKKLLSVYRFQQMCLQSDERMRTLLEQHSKTLLVAAPAQIVQLSGNPHATVFALNSHQHQSTTTHISNVDPIDITVGDIKDYPLFEEKDEPLNNYVDVQITTPQNLQKRRKRTSIQNQNSPGYCPKRRKIFTIAEKTNIIRKLESGASNTALARELGISHSTISTIWKNRDAIIQSYDTESNQRRRLRASQNCDIEQSLLEWIKVQRSLNIPLNGTMIQLRANQIAKALGKDYYCTESWVYRFRVRHNVDVQKVQRHQPSMESSSRKSYSSQQQSSSTSQTRQILAK